MMSDVSITGYEGLVRSTAARYAPALPDFEFDDITQILRVKVWQARRAYDPRRSQHTEKNYVFMCVTNRVKDLLKEQKRLLDNRKGAQLYITDVAGDAAERFERDHLSVVHDEIYHQAEDEEMRLPSTLTHLERQVVALLLLDFGQTEMARQLGRSRQQIRTAHASVKVKMADWKLDSAVAATLDEIAA